MFSCGSNTGTGSSNEEFYFSLKSSSNNYLFDAAGAIQNRTLGQTGSVAGSTRNSFSGNFVITSSNFDGTVVAQAYMSSTNTFGAEGITLAVIVLN
jgi:hypothetical protein